MTTANGVRDRSGALDLLKTVNAAATYEFRDILIPQRCERVALFLLVNQPGTVSIYRLVGGTAVLHQSTPVVSSTTETPIVLSWPFAPGEKLRVTYLNSGAGAATASMRVAFDRDA